MTILLLGASGYVGTAFRRALQKRGEPFVALTRQDHDYSQFSTLLQVLHELKPTFLINAAGYTGRPNVDACEVARAETLLGNVVLPVNVMNACEATGTPWGHVASGCLYQGAKIVGDGADRYVADMRAPEPRSLIETNRDTIQGFTENDPPNFSFRSPPCSFYSGTKSLAEESLANASAAYLWRLRLPFGNQDDGRNYVSKLLRYPKVYDNYNSLSHLDQYVAACLDLWRLRAPFGVYNITNPGFVSAREVVQLISTVLRPERTFEFWENDEVFYRTAATAPRSNCILDSGKLIRAGVNLPHVRDALVDCLQNWESSSAT